MNAANINTSARQLRPFLSVTIIVITLFSIVFFQMEERRLGYSILKLTRTYKKSHEIKKNLEIQLAKVTRPQLLEKMAQQKFTLKKVQSNQIIHLSSPNFENNRKEL